MLHRSLVPSGLTRSFLQGTAEEGFSGIGFQDKVQRIGYGENDEQLGGGFIADDTTVFYATAESSQYWKVETKDRYTGKGWERTVEGEFATGIPGRNARVGSILDNGYKRIRSI